MVVGYAEPRISSVETAVIVSGYQIGMASNDLIDVTGLGHEGGQLHDHRRNWSMWLQISNPALGGESAVGP